MIYVNAGWLFQRPYPQIWCKCRYCAGAHSIRGGRRQGNHIGHGDLLLPPPPLQPYRNAVKLHLESPLSYISFKAKITHPFPIYFTDNQTCTSILRAVATSTTKVYLSTSVCLLPFDEEKMEKEE